MNNLKKIADTFSSKARNQDTTFFIGFFNNDEEYMEGRYSVYDMMRFMSKMMETLPREGKTLMALFVTYLYANDGFDFDNPEAGEILADLVLSAEEMMKDEEF